MANTYVEDPYKGRLKDAAKYGRGHNDPASCKAKFPCDNLDKVSAIPIPPQPQFGSQFQQHNF